MKVLFRADASYSIGSGHVMRCLTLAGALRSRGAQCAFASRPLEGNMIDAIRDEGYSVYVMSAEGSPSVEEPLATGASKPSDARETSLAVSEYAPDWLVVDHYEIDQHWERQMVGCARLMIVDDLADRSHVGDVLVNQNLAASFMDYQGLVSKDCELLLGTKYAILRPEFLEARNVSRLRRRASELLIAMGGSDPDDATGEALEAIRRQYRRFPQMERVSVILGANAVWCKRVREIAASMPIPTTVDVAVLDMARRMTGADLSIGAGGTTSWERCCVGLPSIVVSIAENQVPIAQNLDRAGAAAYMGPIHSQTWKERLVGALEQLVSNPFILEKMSSRAFELVDGLGADRICNSMQGR